jgi:ATP-dependent DNA ligase
MLISKNFLRRDDSRVRCFTRNGHDWASRFPAIVDAALRIKAMSFLIDGEAVIARVNGTSDFRALSAAILTQSNETSVTHLIAGWCRMTKAGKVPTHCMDFTLATIMED